MEVARFNRTKKQRYGLAGEICPDCRTPLFPPRAVCPHCGGDAKKEKVMRESALAHDIQYRPSVKTG